MEIYLSNKEINTKCYLKNKNIRKSCGFFCVIKHRLKLCLYTSHALVSCICFNLCLCHLKLLFCMFKALIYTNLFIYTLYFSLCYFVHYQRAKLRLFAIYHDVITLFNGVKCLAMTSHLHRFSFLSY